MLKQIWGGNQPVQVLGLTPFDVSLGKPSLLPPTLEFVILEAVGAARRPAPTLSMLACGDGTGQDRTGQDRKRKRLDVRQKTVKAIAR